MCIDRLSVVDVGWPGHVQTLVPELERLGYHRYWATEHYSPSQSASPTVLAGVAAQCTSRIRIGTAGVLLTLAPPLRVVNDFSLLELLYPGRIDLGVAGATGGDIVVDALANGAPPQPNQYMNRLRELARLQRLTSWSNGDEQANVIGPISRSQPPLWVCGTGYVSAQLAGELGAGYAFHDHLSPQSTSGPDVLDTYLDTYLQAFTPSVFRSKPEIVVACTGAVGHSDAEAKSALTSRGLERSSFCGTPEMVHEQLQHHGERYDVAELALYVVAESFTQQLDGYRAIAELGDLASADNGRSPVTTL